MGNKECFETIKQHLLAQGARCIAPGIGCRLRNAYGLACAVGALIPDSEYDESMNQSLASMILRYAPDVNMSLIWDLVGAHDSGFIDEANIDRIGRRYGCL